MSPSAIVLPTPNVAFAAFSLRVSAASTAARDLVLEFARAGMEGDLDGAAQALQELDTWAERERDWLASNPPELCWRLAHDAFAGALSKVGRAVPSLRYALSGFGETDEGELETRIEDLLAANEQLEHAVAVAGKAACKSAGPSAHQARPPRAFEELVADVNRRYRALERDSRSVDYVLAFLALQEELAQELALLATVMPATSGIGDCQDAAQNIVAFLRSKAAEATPEAVESGFFLVAYILLTQREKCAAVRTFEGLPPPVDGDVI